VPPAWSTTGGSGGGGAGYAGAAEALAEGGALTVAVTAGGATAMGRGNAADGGALASHAPREAATTSAAVTREIDSSGQLRRRRDTSRPRPISSPAMPATPQRSPLDPSAGDAEHATVVLQVLPLRLVLHVAVVVMPCDCR
jgi:hypothetical protein